MNVMRKVVTALRGSARESAEVIIDANALRIFEQEIHDAERSVSQAKQQLAYIISERVQLERESHALQQQISLREEQATTTLNEGDQALACELAEDILDKEHVINEQQVAIKNLAEREHKITLTIKTSAKQIQGFRREFSIAKATSRAQQVSTRASHHTGSTTCHIQDLQDSLGRIKQRQQRVDDTEAAMNMIESSIGDSALDKKIIDAGMGDRDRDIQKVLERLKKPQ